MTHIIRISRKDPWRPEEHIRASDSPRVADLMPEIIAGEARIEQTGDVGSKPGTYPISLSVVDPSGHRSEWMAVTVVRQ